MICLETMISWTTVGGIINRIREKLNVNQSNDSVIEIDNNLARLIECDEIPVKIDNTQLICKNINEVFEDKNIDLIIEPEDLFNPTRYDAKEKAEAYISELEKHKDDKNYVIDLDDLDDLEFLLNEYDLMDKKIKAYELIGDIYFNSRNYEKEYEYMLKAWELRTRYPNRKLNYRVMIKLASNYIDRGKYEDAIALYQKALLNVNDIPREYLSHLYYNYALACYRINLCSISLEIISDTLKCVERKDYDLWRKTYIIEGGCYFKMGDYESALSSYNKALQVLTFTGYSDVKYLIYGNMAEAYTKLRDYKRAYKYLDGILKDIKKLDKGSNNYTVILNQLAVSYENLGELEKAEKYYKESLEYAKRNVQKNYILKNLTSLINLSTKIEIKDILNIIDQYSDDIVPDIKVNDNLLIVLKSLKAYVDNKEYDKFAKLIDSII